MKKILFIGLTCGFCIPALFAFNDVPRSSELDLDLARLSTIGPLPDNTSPTFSGSANAQKTSLISFAALASCKPCESQENQLGTGAWLFRDRSNNDVLNLCSATLDQKFSLKESFGTLQESCPSLLNASGSWCGNTPVPLEGALRAFIATMGLSTTSTGIIDKSIALGLLTDAEKNTPLTSTISRAKLAHLARITADINRCETSVSDRFSAPVAIHIYPSSNTYSCRGKWTEITGDIRAQTSIDLFAETLMNTGASFTWRLSKLGSTGAISATGQCLNDITFPSAGNWTVQVSLDHPQFTNKGIATIQRSVTSSGIIRCSVATCACPDGLVCTSNDQALCSSQATCQPINTTSARIATQTALVWEAPYTVKLKAIVTGTGEHTRIEWSKDSLVIQTWSLLTLSLPDPGSHTIGMTVKEGANIIAQSSIVVAATESIDIDRDGLTNNADACPQVFGPKNNRGCPIILASCGEGNPCPQGFSCTSRERSTTTLSGVCRPSSPAINDACLSVKIREGGIIGGRATCTRCPCEYQTDFLQNLRSCDILIPAILSPDKSNILARGVPYRIQ